MGRVVGWEWNENGKEKKDRDAEGGNDERKDKRKQNVENTKKENG